MKNEKGLTLLALVITIIVLVILAGVSITLIFREDNIVEKSKWAKFATEFREVEEKQQLYLLAQIKSEYINKTTKSIEEKNGLTSVVTQEEKNKIKIEKTSLVTKMEQLSGKSMDSMQIYWLDKQKIDTNQKKTYILDVENHQLYQYEGEEIFGLIWYTLENGSKKEESLPTELLYLYNYGDSCQNVTSGWNYIKGRYYPKSFVKLQENYMEFTYGGYVATDLKSIPINNYSYLNIEIEGTSIRNQWTEFSIRFYDQLGEYSNEYAWNGETSINRIFSNNDPTKIEKKMISINIDHVPSTTKILALLACEGRDYRVYSVSLSKEPLAPVN